MHWTVNFCEAGLSSATKKLCRQLFHSPKVPICHYRCFQQRVALADTEGATDFLGDDDSAESIDAADNA